jgi:hypothetical protein
MGGSFLKTGRSGPSLYADGRSDAYFKPRWARESGAGESALPDRPGAKADIEHREDVKESDFAAHR